MTKYQNTFIFLSLILLTLGMIALPIFYNSLGFEYSFDEKIYWEYTAETNRTLTSQQVIDFYSNGFKTDSFHISDDYENEDLKEGAIELINSIFDEYIEINDYLQKLVRNNNIKYSENYYLSLIDDSPVIFNIVSVCLFTEYEYIEFVYESKTQTLITLDYDKISDETTSTIDITDLQKALYQYYKNTLQLSENQFLEESVDGYIHFSIWNQNYEQIYDDY